MHSMFCGLDTHIGMSILKMMRNGLPRLKEDVIFPRIKARFDWREFLAYRFPIDMRNAERDDPARFVTQFTFNMIYASVNAMVEMRSGNKIETPVLLIGGTQDEICSAKKNIRISKEIFSNVEVKTFSSTHAFLPCTHDKHDDDILRAIAEFFDSMSHNVTV